MNRAFLIGHALDDTLHDFIVSCLIFNGLEGEFTQFDPACNGLEYVFNGLDPACNGFDPAFNR